MSKSLAAKFVKMLDADPALRSILNTAGIFDSKKKFRQLVPKKFRLRCVSCEEGEIGVALAGEKILITGQPISPRLEKQITKKPIWALKPQHYKPFLITPENVKSLYLRSENGAVISGGGDDPWYVLSAELIEWLVKNRDRVVALMQKEGYEVQLKKPASRRK